MFLIITLMSIISLIHLFIARKKNQEDKLKSFEFWKNNSFIISIAIFFFMLCLNTFLASTEYESASNRWFGKQNAQFKVLEELTINTVLYFILIPFFIGFFYLQTYILKKISSLFFKIKKEIKIATGEIKNNMNDVKSSFLLTESQKKFLEKEGLTILRLVIVGFIIIFIWNLFDNEPEVRYIQKPSYQRPPVINYKNYQQQPEQQRRSGNCFFSHEQNTSGFFKNCAYDCLSDVYFNSIRVTRICPLTAKFPR